VQDELAINFYYSNLVYSLCSDNDKIVTEFFIGNFTQILDSELCKDHQISPFICKEIDEEKNDYPN
jgi:hypothetical protein